MNSVIEHTIKAVNAQLLTMGAARHCMLLGKYDYTLLEEKYSDVMTMTTKMSLSLYPTRNIPGLDDRESACCCVYVVDNEGLNRVQAIRSIASHFVTKILPRMEYKYRALLHAEEVEQILSVLD